MESGLFIADRADAGDSRREVRRIRLVLPFCQAVSEVAAMDDRVCLMTIADHAPAAKFRHGVVDDQTGISRVRRIGRLSEESAILVEAEDTVPAVGAPSHDPVHLDHVLARGVYPHDDTPARVRVPLQGAKVHACLFYDTVLVQVDAPFDSFRYTAGSRGRFSNPIK